MSAILARMSDARHVPLERLECPALAYLRVMYVSLIAECSGSWAEDQPVFS